MPSDGDLPVRVASSRPEEVVVGYLLTRLEQARWLVAWAVTASALVRGAYHLYQGFGGFVGKVVKGVVFVLVWRRPAASSLWCSPT